MLVRQAFFYTFKHGLQCCSVSCIIAMLGKHALLKEGLYMTNFDVYRKTLPFSFIEFGVSLIGMAIIVGAAFGGFAIANATSDLGLVGLVVGLFAGVLLMIPFSIFFLNPIKAAQIAMMTKGVTENELPAHCVKEGFNEIKGRFGKITVFFLITNAIRGIFHQIGRGISKIGNAIGGEVGGSVTSAVNSAIETVISFLCDCCLGWVLYRKDENSFKAACEGAAIFFKHGKTLVRNIGRIFGIGLASLAVIGGLFFGLAFLILSQLPAIVTALGNEITEAFIRNGEEVPAWLQTPTTVTIVLAAIVGIMFWTSLHSVLVRPFILVGVLRNFMEAGKKDIPAESDFAELERISPRFARFRTKADGQQ